MMRVKKTAEEVQEQIKNAIPDDGFINLPVFRCLPAKKEESVLDEEKEQNGVVASLISKVKEWFSF